MTHCPPQRHTRPAYWLAALVLIALATPSQGDVVDHIDHGKLDGTVSLQEGDDQLALTDARGQTQRVKLIDIDQVRFNVDLTPPPIDQLLLIENDTGVGLRQKYAKAKLRAGLHRITIPYWQADDAHALALYISGPSINGRPELGADHLRCFRNTSDQSDASAGNDAEGYRLPELSLKEAANRRRLSSRARYRLYTGDDTPPTSVNAIAEMRLKRSGTTSLINTGMLNEQNRNVGLVFDAFFKADQDGQYKFTLASDDGSQLYFGQVNGFEGNLSSGPASRAPWHADLVNEGVAQGDLKTIIDERMTFHIPQVGDIALAMTHARAVWDKKVTPANFDRDNEPSNEDTVYLRDKNDINSIRSVSGKIVTLDDDALTLVFRGKDRTITRDRVVGMVFKHSSRPAPPAPGTHQVLELQGGQALPCRIKTIGDRITFQLIGGSQAAVPREVAREMARLLRVENGRRIDLTRIPPNAEEAIPYFGLELPHKVNTDFSGKPITLYDEKIYGRGLAVHSKSRLHYKLKPNCERFQATFGLLAPGGKLGDVTARVIGDGNVLWEQKNITAQTHSIDLDVELKGIQRLILEVDFGQGQNVGDRAAWCNPRLIYGSEQSP